VNRNLLSPLQFGWKLTTSEAHSQANAARRGTPTRRSVSADIELHTGQGNIFKNRVDDYASGGYKAPGGVPMYGDERPELVEHEGKVYIGEGHHRLAAAKQRGDTHFDVNWWGNE